MDYKIKDNEFAVCLFSALTLKHFLLRIEEIKKNTSKKCGFKKISYVLLMNNLFYKG